MKINLILQSCVPSNFKFIENNFNAKFVVRNGEIIVQGKQEEIELIEKLFSELFFLIKRNDMLSITDIETSISVLKNNGKNKPTISQTHKNHVFLRLKNINNTVDMFYSIDGEKWKKIENSLEVSCYNHNVLGGFLSLRLGLCSIGEGKVKFKNFIYKSIK